MDNNGNVSLTENIANRLTEIILVEKKWGPNEKLPNERDLSEYFNVGRSSIREAIKSLVTKGILVVKQGSGTYVSENPSIPPDPLNFAEIKDLGKMLREWYQVRMLLEPNAMKFVVESATEDEVTEICRLSALETDLIRRSFTPDFMSVDRKFHITLAQATHNTILEKTLTSIQQSFYYNITMNQYMRLLELHKDNASKYHPAIAEFIRLRDAGGAETAMRLHMATALETLNKTHINL